MINMGYDRLIWNITEHRDAVCAVPFTINKGEIDAPRLIIKGIGGSLFGKKSFNVKRDNFAKMRCYGKSNLKDPSLHGKDIHCVGIDMNGNPIATEKIEKSKNEQLTAVERLSKKEWNDPIVKSTKLAEACLAAITGKRQIKSISFEKTKTLPSIKTKNDKLEFE